MQSVIMWCNANQGFVSALLALVSLALSSAAIIVSIIVDRLPFRKKLAIGFYTNMGVGLSDGLQFYSVEATNIGNRTIKVSFVGIGFREHTRWKKAINHKKPNPTNTMLNVNETVIAQYDIIDINKLMSEKRIYAIAIDIEGKVYKRKIK